MKWNIIIETMKYVFVKNAMDLYEYVEKLIVDEEKYYIFLDEIQMIEELEQAINSFHATKNVSIFITGSNSRLLSGELATLLAGLQTYYTRGEYKREYLLKKRDSSKKIVICYYSA